MKVIKTEVSIIFNQTDLNNLEQEFFSCMSGFNNKLGSEAINDFKKMYPKLYELYDLIKIHRETIRE